MKTGNKVRKKGREEFGDDLLAQKGQSIEVTDSWAKGCW